MEELILTLSFSYTCFDFFIILTLFATWSSLMKQKVARMVAR